MRKKSFFGIILLCLLSSSICADSIRSNYITIDSVNLHYTDNQKMNVPVVILLHGFNGDLTMWHDSGIAQKLTKNYRVIAIDLRGHGKSSKPKRTSDYGPKMGEDVIHLLDHLSIAKAHMIGFSMGASVVGRLLVTHSDRIHSATLGSSSFPLMNDEEKAFQESTAKALDSEGDQALASVVRGWALDSLSREQIKKVTVPFQAIFGSEEKGAYYDLQKELSQLPISARPLIIINGADHDSQNAAVLQDEFLNAANQLIDRVSSKSK